LIKANRDLHEETHKRLEALELFFKNEQKGIKDRVISEVKQIELEILQTASRKLKLIARPNPER
jgi:hypothetical protein